MMDIHTINRVRAEIKKMITTKTEHIVHSVDTVWRSFSILGVNSVL
jgi:hypothetical protein